VSSDNGIKKRQDRGDGKNIDEIIKHACYNVNSRESGVK